MRRVTLAAIVSAALSGAASPADASHLLPRNETIPCASKIVRHAKTIVRSAHGVVFEKAKQDEGGPVVATYACLRRFGPIRRLDDQAEFSYARDPQLAGRYVAYDLGSEEGETSFSRIVVIDLRTGATKADAGAMPGVTLIADVSRFVVKRNGSVAWIGETDSGEQGVWRIDSNSPDPQRLDSSPPQIDPGSFRLGSDRRTISWTKGGVQQRAPID